jgi:ATP-dependent Clp protease ATP-binding subunit ClpA
MVRITGLQLRALERKLEGHGLRLEISDEAVDELAKRGFDPVYGARPLRRLIQRELEGDIARAMLARNIREGGVIEVSLQDGELHVEFSQAGDPATV